MPSIPGLADDRLAYSIKQTAHLISVSPSKVRLDIKAGRLAVYKLGGRVLVPAHALAEYLEKHLSNDGAPIKLPTPWIQKRVDRAARREAEQGETHDERKLRRSH